MIDLTGKTAVILGLANQRSIAWGIAQQLHKAGARLAIGYQNERLRQMQTLAKLGPTYPKQLLSLHGAIPFLDERGPNDQTVIECEVDELPPGYAERRK